MSVHSDAEITDSDYESGGESKPTATVQVPKKKRNLSHSIRKSIGSQVASSKVGRHVIQNYVGTEGNNIIGALKNALTKYANADVAKKQKHLMLKFVVKITLMAREGLINPDNSKILVEPLILLKKRILRALDPENDNPNVNKLIESFMVVHKALHKLTSPFMKPQNVKLLDSLFETMSRKDFVIELVTNPGYETDKTQVMKAVKVLVAFEDFPYEPKENLLSTHIMKEKYAPVVLTLQAYFMKVEDKSKEIVKVMHKSWGEKFPDDNVLFLREGADPKEGAQALVELCCKMVKNLYSSQLMVNEVRQLRLKYFQLDIPIEKYDQTRWTIDYSISLILKSYPIRVRITWKVVFQFMLWLMFESGIDNHLNHAEEQEEKGHASDGDSSSDRKESRHQHKISQLDAHALLVEFGVVKEDDDIFFADGDSGAAGESKGFEPSLDTLDE